MNCKVCNTTSQQLFSTTVLNKYEVVYFKCPSCDFIQTEKPYWLQEAYREAIADADVGYVTRNLLYADLVSVILNWSFDKRAAYLDYGGGYGLFVRLMRDKGFNFYRQDIYCKNIFAQHFDVQETTAPKQFELLTAFEVFEHLEFPMEEIARMMQYADAILFSTELQPTMQVHDPKDWWYFMPDSGQHIAFYSKKTLQQMATQLNCFLYSNGADLHLLSRKKYSLDPVKYISVLLDLKNKLLGKYYYNRKSLLQTDFNKIKGLQTISEKKVKT